MIKEKKTLLEKAKLVNSVKTHQHFINEEKLELGIAWAKEEISIAQLIAVLQFQSPNKAYTFLSNCFKAYINTEEQRNLKNNQQ
jgi:hypothetical protein